MKTIVILLGSVLGIIATIILMFGLTYGGQEWMRFFAPRAENIRREVFEETRSYNQAKLQELANYRHQYMVAAASGKEEEAQAIASTIRLRFADYDGQRMPPELSQFLQEIKGW